MADDAFATDRAQIDFGALIDAFMPLAQGLLERDGFFTPFAAYLDGEGEARGLAVQDLPGQASDIEDPDAAVTSLEGALRSYASRGEVQAAMILADIRFITDDAPTNEAVYGRFEHRDGSAMELMMPYELTDGNLAFREPSASPGRALGLTARQH